MLKSKWIEALKKLEALKDTAVSNKTLAAEQLEELDLTISAYNAKIKDA